MMKSIAQLRLLFFSGLLLFCVVTFCSIDATAQLKAGQARSMIARVDGSEFPSSAVHIKQVSQGTDKIASVTAEIETAFRFELNADGRWRVRDIRIGPQRWEDVGRFWSSPSQSDLAGRSACDGLGPGSSELNVKRARCLLAQLLGVDLPSDAVRIKEVSPFALPLSSGPSAVVVALIRMEFGFEKQGKEGWRILAVRTGNREWANLDDLRNTVNEAKKQQALADLHLIADALARFHQDRGFYVSTDNHRLLIDHLAPHYLSRIIRLDPWHKPYEYQGDRDHFTLRSDGPDGKPNTSDDLVLSN